MINLIFIFIAGILCGSFASMLYIRWMTDKEIEKSNEEQKKKINSVFKDVMVNMPLS